MAAQGLLYVLPTREKQADFFIEGIRYVPGTQSVGLCLIGVSKHIGDFEEGCQVCPDLKKMNKDRWDCQFDFSGMEDIWVLPLSASTGNFGFLKIRDDGSGELEEFRSHIINFANSFAMTLENQWQRENLESINVKLNEEVHARKKGEEKYRFLADNQPALIWGSGPDKLCNYFNKTWLEFTGRSLEQELGNGWAEGVHPDDLERCIKIYHKAFDARESFEMEYRLSNAEGSYRWTLVKGHPRFETNGTFIGYLGTCVDIEERKIAEENLRVSERRLNNSVKGSAEGMWDWPDVNKKSLWWSPRFFEILGYENNEIEVVISTFFDNLHPDDREKVEGAVQRHFKDNTPYDIEYRLKTKSGEHIWIHAHGEAQRDGNGEPIGMSGSVQDINRRKKAEDKLQKHEEHLERLVKERTMDLVLAKEGAEKANKAKSEFLSRMSHELRTPLNAILGFSQLMVMSPKQGLTEEHKSSVGHISKAGNHLLELIDEVLDLNKIEAGKPSIIEENVNASLIVEEVISQILPSAQENGVQISNRLALHSNHFIRADHTAFGQIMLNLLSNAVKYNEEGGAITVDGGVCGYDRVWVSVSDTGPGVSNENMEALFEPLNRLGQEYGEIKGNGIGLAISRSLAEYMGGSISAECELGKGCCFKVELPAGSREAVSNDIIESDSEISTSDVQSKNHKILYIEDNHQNLVLVEKILEQRPHVTFLSALHPREGIELARAHQPDLILMDINLPEMDGITAYKELQKFHETCEIPVIAVSARAMEKDINKALDSGFKDYLTKPIDIGNFFSKIDKFLTP
ncbi:MAG: PAS domain-containing protein [Nitrospina sp.]|nr:PAS domain-containing protein [Nitrospina sp.]MBT7197136.1 PAS domain-containing protein [Nitrospina sp.]